MPKYVPGSDYSFSQEDANRILKAIVVPLCNYLDLSELIKAFQGRMAFGLNDVGFENLPDLKNLPYDLFAPGAISDDEWKILLRDAMRRRFEEALEVLDRPRASVPDT